MFQGGLYKAIQRRGIFNRSKEINWLQNHSRAGNNCMTVVTGAAGVGKSAVLTEFSNKHLRECKGRPIYLKFEGTYMTEEIFTRQLKASLWNSYYRSKEKDFLSSVMEVPDTDMISLLNLLARRFKQGWDSDADYPTLIIDEADCLHEWSPNLNGQMKCRILEDWLLYCNHLANVILCSSNGLYPVWMLLSGRFLCFPIDELVESEARLFFLEESALDEKSLTEERWKDIYDFVGGRMGLLKEAAHALREIQVSNADVEGSMQVTWHLFKRRQLESARKHVMQGFYPSRVAFEESMEFEWMKWLKGVFTPSSDAEWTAKQYESALEKICASETGFVSKGDLDLPPLTSTGIFKRKFLHCQFPTLSMGWYKGSWPIVTLPSRPEFHAAKDILKARAPLNRSRKLARKPRQKYNKNLDK